MNMKRIVFKIAKSFCACFITLLFFSCSNSESVMEKERKSTVIIDIKQNGLGYELKSKEVPYITRRQCQMCIRDSLISLVPQVEI